MINSDTKNNASSSFSGTDCSEAQITGAEALMRSLEYQGVKTIFGYPGGSIMPVFDALYDHRKTLNHILVRHEQGAAHAAQGFARVSGEVGVCLVTSGPGATNTITGIADAMIDSTPIVVIAGQVGTNFLGTDAFQEVDLVGITQPITKWSYQIRRAEDVAWAVARAFYVAKSGRPGPVVLDFAKNAQVDKTEYVPTKVDYIRSYLPVPEMNSEAIRQAAELINGAVRPLVLVGQGVELGEAQQELRTFIEKAGMPAGCTLLGLSALPTAHPLNKGMLGMHGNLGPNINTGKCDVLIAVGMRFDDRVTGKLSTYATQAKIIHFDIDPAEIDKNVKVDVAVLGNCKETLAAVTELLKPAEHKEWLETFLPYEKVEEEKVIRPELHPAGKALSMGEVVRAVSEATGNEAILVTDVGQNQMMAARYFKYSKKRSIVTSGGLGTMGFGLPAAIGATFGSPDRTVCVFMGDGGLQMNIQELGTVMEQKAPVKIILLNNNFLGNVRQWQAMFFNRRYSFTPMMNPDYMKIASAYAIPARRVMKRDELAAAIDEMIATDGPFLLEACVEEEGNVMPMTPPGGSVNQMLLEC
ncbi:biosynthetic-type acetolactate synthase large subunit [Bacteroides heparinolyticus]|uniref:Acetolactate synthase n=6 Tax=Prevotella heparinolytica TaxID=28113 RepID=A0A3P2ADY6_9BACE|nr:biosynthetic-type acetolactate synthase large subunit [Bacteroides heparinolyticus]MCF0256857.1 biosynthetic-type acetolactate synthase large subunit [Bacteroides heparinolyticus]RRD93298.1 biosynthetic-type acetolactate synthase large subunit [Bacteroides heparinolyticus]VFB14057.1 acetolactate synthase, large subunit [Bacteroides heparinolyticus]